MCARDEWLQTPSSLGSTNQSGRCATRGVHATNSEPLPAGGTESSLLAFTATSNTPSGPYVSILLNQRRFSILEKTWSHALSPSWTSVTPLLSFGICLSTLEIGTGSLATRAVGSQS